MPMVFQRNRITHAKTFARLMYKTRVFISSEGDHYRRQRLNDRSLRRDLV